jgi:hypothetical protein
MERRFYVLCTPVEHLLRTIAVDLSSALSNKAEISNPRIRMVVTTICVVYYIHTF